MSSSPAIRRKQRRFSAAGRADKDDELATFRFEVDVVQHLHGAERLADGFHHD
jgi:hypothetical protein